MQLRDQSVAPRRDWTARYTYIYSDDHEEPRNLVACAWMFACEEKRGMWSWCGDTSVRMRTLRINGN